MRSTIRKGSKPCSASRSTATTPDGALHAISNHLHVRVDGDMDFDKPAIPNLQIWKLPVQAKPYTRP
jgi:hypothetical protein